MPNNLGLQYKSGFGSALRVGSISFLFAGVGGDSAYTAKTFYQNRTPRISGISKTILANEPFIWTYRILPEAVTGSDIYGGVTNAPTVVYRGDGPITNILHMNFNFQNGRYVYFNFIANEGGQGGIILAYNAIVPTNQIYRNKVYNFTLYKNEGPFTAASSYRFYMNGELKTLTNAGSVIYDGNTARIPLNQLSSVTFNDIYFGGSFGTAFPFSRTVPMYVFNNSVFKLDTGLTTTYIDNLVTELHRVDNYIHLLPTAYSVNPTNAVYYFPLYLKEGKDIRDYYNPSKKFYIELVLGNVSAANLQSPIADFVSTGTTNYQANQPTQSASVYKGPYNIWKKPYPPYDPYI